jgi:hypothetical protein
VAGSSRTWDTIIVLSAFGAIAADWLAIPEPVRWVVVGWFLIVCPGMAVVRLLRLQEPAAEWMLAFAVSISLDMIVSEVMVYAGLWAPSAGLLIIAAITVLAVAIPLLLAPAGEPHSVGIADPVSSDVASSGRGHRSAPPARADDALSALRAIMPVPSNTPPGAAESITKDAAPVAPSKLRRRRTQPRTTIAFDPLDDPALEKRSGLASEGIIRELAVDHLKKRR